MVQRICLQSVIVVIQQFESFLVFFDLLRDQFFLIPFGGKVNPIFGDNKWSLQVPLRGLLLGFDALSLPLLHVGMVEGSWSDSCPDRSFTHVHILLDLMDSTKLTVFVQGVVRVVFLVFWLVKSLFLVLEYLAVFYHALPAVICVAVVVNRRQFYNVFVEGHRILEVYRRYFMERKVVQAF